MEINVINAKACLGPNITNCQLCNFPYSKTNNDKCIKNSTDNPKNYKYEIKVHLQVVT